VEVSISPWAYIAKLKGPCGVECVSLLRPNYIDEFKEVTVLSTGLLRGVGWSSILKIIPSDVSNALISRVIHSNLHKLFRKQLI